jgi:hypothetical protein
MTRRYADPVDVRREDDAPSAFVWRGRLYSVRAVLGHWMEAGGWWAASRDVPTARPQVERDVPTARPQVERDVPTARPQVERAPTGALDEGEQEIWRVEARSGRAGAAGVFELRFDWSGGGWTLARAHD